MSLFSVLSVSASGMAAQRYRAEYLAENLANSETTRTQDGGPYRRKDVVFEASPESSPFSAEFKNQLGPGGTGVEVCGGVENARRPEKRYMPGHPNADK